MGPTSKQRALRIELPPSFPVTKQCSWSMYFVSGSTASLKRGETLIFPLFRKISLARLSLLQQGNGGPSDPKPFNTKITHYMRNGCVKEAQKMFDEMPNRNTVTWNCMIRGYFKNGNFQKALLLFHQMPNRDLFSYNTMIAGLMQYGDTNGAEQIFAQMSFRDVVTWNSMIAGYIRNTLMDDAFLLFNQMPSRNVISWNMVITGLVNLQAIDLAEQLFKEMPIRDVASWTIMISGLTSAGRMVEACALFEDMPLRDVKVWNTMMAGFIGNNNIEIAEGLFQKMPERDSDSWNELLNGLVGCQRVNAAMRLFSDMPYKGPRSWNSILLGLIRNGLLEEAHVFLEKNPYNDVVSWTNMIIGYFEIGDVGTAIKLFELMPDKDETAWNATIFELGENDHGEVGLKYFVKMKEKGPPPDEATFTSILTISSYLSSLDFGKQSHAQIIKAGYNCFIAVSNAVVTMYARCGGMHYAFLEFSSMPIHDVISWNSIICGFAHNGNAIEALNMFKQMRSTDVKPDQITFIGVLSACSHAGLIDHGGYYFNFMRYKCFLQPTCEHYTCMVDLFGRSGLINEAVTFIGQMKSDGVEVSSSVWGALLGSCRTHKKVKVGEIAAENILLMEPYNAGVYLILAEIYLNGEMRDDAERVWSRMKERGVKKQPGCSWIEVNNVVQVFLAGDCSHSEVCSVYCILDLLRTEMEMSFMEAILVD